MPDIIRYLTKGADPEPALRIHEEVPPEIVEHDGVALGVLRELAPDHTQRLHLGKKKSPNKLVTR